MLLRSRQLDPFGLGSPVAILVVSSVIYCAIAYVILRRIKSPPSGRHLTVLTAIVILLAVSACVLSISPLWPRGVSQLAERERQLRVGLPLGSDLSSAEAFLQRQGIDSREFEAKAEEVVLQTADFKMVARPGDHVLSAIVPTDAAQISLRLQHRCRSCI